MSDLISREEVLNLLDTAFENGAFDGRYAYENLVDAIQNLIHPLEKEFCEDAVSRYAAINALWKALYEYEDKTEKQFIESDELNVADWIEHRIFVQNMSDIDRQTILALPSAWPEKRTEERTKTHACDCISRKAAIDALSHMMDTDGFRDGWAVSRANVDCMLRYLPSVEPERKQGKWLLKIEDWNRWTCSECGFSTRTDIHVTLGYDYCPKCGAPMEVDG